jgi:hypothetical protein
LAIFSEILPLFGVDAKRASMMVPVGGFNLIYHFLGKGVKFAVNAGKNHADNRLPIKDITDQFRKTPDITKIFNHPSSSMFVDNEDMTALMQAAARNLTTDPSQRLLAISANKIGLYTVTLRATNRTETLTVRGLTERPTKISFRYVKYTGASPPSGATEPTTSKGTTRTKGEGQGFADLLNRYFRHQANISVTLKSSDDLGIDTAFGGTFDDDMFDRLLGSKFDKDADTTVFVVPFIKDKEGVKKSPRAVMVAQKPMVVWSGDKGLDSFTGDADVDGFLYVSAHELAHALGGHHEDSDGLLLSGPKHNQSFLIDPDTLTQINPQYKR